MNKSDKKASPFAGKEEATLRKAIGDDVKRWKVYEDYLKAIQKPDVKEVTLNRGKLDIENGLKKFLDTWHSQLKPLFAKAQVPLVRYITAPIMHFH